MNMKSDILKVFPQRTPTTIREKYLFKIGANCSTTNFHCSYSKP